jgi:hypothetical protein
MQRTFALLDCVVEAETAVLPKSRFGWVAMPAFGAHIPMEEGDLHKIVIKKKMRLI